MLSAVQHFYPDTWDKELDYRQRTYHLKDVLRNTSEFNTVEGLFYNTGVKVTEIKRIQNPYVLGAYILRKEQLKHRNIQVTERTMFHAVNPEDLLAALDYNLDVRRYNYSSGEKCPTLYASSNAAINQVNGIIVEVIICDVITKNSYTFTQIESDCDTERFPKYVVKIIR